MFTYILLAMAGFVVKHLFAFQKFNRQTPEISFKITVLKYLEINGIGMIASAIVIWVLCFLLTLDGGAWFVEKFTGGNIPADTPAGVLAFLFVVGYMIDSIILILNGIINPIKLTLTKVKEIE